MEKLRKFLSEKFEERKIENKIKSISLNLDVAEQNFKNQKTDAEIKIDTLISKFKDEEDIKTIIKEISETMDSAKEAELGIEKINNMRKLLN